ncbi:hypothetical protein [Streptomyces sp. NRRL F-2580]|uniref:hypothetical protein n=1 Tax=Streptomyces sp. NRRL F-2580 TaxID=1463841 RepID=UPI00068C2031|nr:hypothetical protein [Streptomyces sp. NRRL F-2580]
MPGLGGAHEAEWISYDGYVQEAVLWFGVDEVWTPRPDPVRQATLLPADVSLTGRGLPHPAVRAAGRYLYVPDLAVVHARLLPELAQDLAAGPLEGGGTLLTSDELRPTPFAAAYEITDVLPFTGAATRAAEQGVRIEADAVGDGLTPQDPQAAMVFVPGPADRPTLLTATPAPS